jgi:hypothetical protein
MTVALDIPVKWEEVLRGRAAAAGQSLEQYLAAWLERELAWEATRIAWQPAHEAMNNSALSDAQLAELLEQEKHTARREKRAS